MIKQHLMLDESYRKLCFPTALGICKMYRPGVFDAVCLPLGKGWIKGTLNMSDKIDLLRFVLQYYLIILILLLVQVMTVTEQLQ